MDFINIFITFTGRINRAKFWIAALIYAAVLVVVAAIVFLGSVTTASALYSIVGLLLAISSIGVTIKRLHDRNKSGRYVLLFWLAPLALFFIGFQISTMSDFVATALWLIAIVIGVWSFIELGCLRGTIGSNQYGPDPLAPEVLTPPVRTHA
jgi:uncharacterized membrane protein YhaH (DUF805 family)